MNRTTKNVFFDIDKLNQFPDTTIDISNLLQNLTISCQETTSNETDTTLNDEKNYYFYPFPIAN